MNKLMQAREAWRVVLAAVVAGILFLALSPLHLTNEYLRADTFEVVTVRSGESVREIAARYTQDPARLSRLSEAVIDINALTPEGDVRAGQTLRIPRLAPDAHSGHAAK